MVCPFGFVAAGIVFGPKAYEKVQQRLGTSAAVIISVATVVSTGYMLNKLLFMIF